MSLNVDQAVDRIIAMRKQEDTVYQFVDYLSPNHFNRKQIGDCSKDEPHGTSPTPQHMWLALEECVRFIDSLSLIPHSPISDEPGSAHSVISNFEEPTSSGKRGLKKCKRNDSFSTTSTFSLVEERTTLEQLSRWRGQMCTWSYVVVDRFGFDRETVEVAFSILDRYIAMDEEPDTITRDEFQIMAMTSLYIAAKTMSFAQRLPIDALVQMSRGYVDAEELIAMELRMLAALNWRLTPPTAMAFVREFVVLLPVSEEQRQDLMVISFYLAEHAVTDSSLIPWSPSLIAVAAILVAVSYNFEGQDGLTISTSALDEFEEKLTRHADIKMGSMEICMLLDRLDAVYQKLQAA